MKWAKIKNVKILSSEEKKGAVTKPLVRTYGHRRRQPAYSFRGIGYNNKASNGKSGEDSDSSSSSSSESDEEDSDSGSDR